MEHVFSVRQGEIHYGLALEIEEIEGDEVNLGPPPVGRARGPELLLEEVAGLALVAQGTPTRRRRRPR